MPRLLPVADEVALAGVRAVQVPQLVHRLRAELHVTEHLLHEEAAERFLVRPRTTGARSEREHVVGVVEDEDRAHRRRLALCGREPTVGELGEVRRVRDRGDDVVLLDDLLVETIGLFGRKAERGFEDRLLPELLDLDRRAEREVSEHADSDEHEGQEHEAREAIAPRSVQRPSRYLLR